ncbi:putative synaptotagmin-7, partial [Apostichopus japonicus]
RKRKSPNFGFEHNDEERIIPTIPKKITTISVQSKISKAKTNTTWANEDVGNIHHNGDTANGAPPERHEGGRGSRKRYERILTESDTGKRSKQKDSSSHKKKFSGRFSPFNLEIGKFVSRKYKKAMSVPMRPKPDFQDATHTFVGGSHVSRSVSSDDMLVAEAIGLLHVHIAHRHTEEELVVTINRISEIDQVDIRTKTDGGISPALYVAGCIMPGSRRRFKTKDSAVSEEPRWEETFLLNDLSFSAIGQLALRFRFILRPAVGQRSIHLGSGTALLQDMEFGSSKDLDIPLIKPTFQHSELGDLHLSLCYQTEAQRLVCLILEAKDLVKTTSVGARTQSSVRIDVISGDRRLDRQKDSAVKETDNPYGTTKFLSYSTDGSALQGVQFLFAVIQKDMVKELIPSASGTWLGAVCEGLEHWQEVIQNPNRPIAAWHSLESPE